MSRAKTPRALIAPATAANAGAAAPKAAAPPRNEKQAKAARRKSQKAAKKRKVVKDAEEHELEVALFGGSTNESSFGRELTTATAAAPATTTAAGANPKKKQKSTHAATDTKSTDAKSTDADASGEAEADALLFQIDKSGSTAAAADSKSDKRERKRAAADGDDDDDDDGGDGREAAAWVDADDATEQVDISSATRLRKLRTATSDTALTGTEYTDRLRHKFTQLNPTAGWAQLPKRKPETTTDGEPDGSGSDDDGDSKSSSVTSSAALSVSSSVKLPANVLHVTKLKDVLRADHTDGSAGVISSVEFHPRGQLLLTACMDKKIRLYNVDTVKNPKVQSVYLPDCQIYTARFAGGNDPTEIIAAGRYKYFYSWDLNSGHAPVKVPGIRGRAERSLESFIVSPDNRYIVFLGNDGFIILVDMKSKQWIANLKMNGSVRGAAFSPDGRYLYSVGSDSEVYTWDVASRKCIARHTDSGQVNATTLALSPDGQYYATGSNSGVVNLYGSPNANELSTATAAALAPPKPAKLTAAAASASSSTAAAVASSNGAVWIRQPLKSFLNLTTPIHRIAFNSDSQLMAMASKSNDSLRMVHVPSMTTFSNWPTSNTPLQSVSAMAFSPNSGLFAIGNARGTVLLYKLNHYTSA